MSIEQVDVFKTSDGKIFPTERAAVVHETTLDFARWYERNKLWSFSGDAADTDGMIGWLTEHKDELMMFLSNFERS